MTTQIAPQFILAYPNPQAAKVLSWSEFETFCKAHRYPNHRRLAQCYDRLQASYPEASPETVLIFQDQTVQLARLLLEMTHIRRQSLNKLLALYRQHPKQRVFASLPGAGDLIGPAPAAVHRRHPAPPRGKAAGRPGRCR